MTNLVKKTFLSFIL